MSAPKKQIPNQINVGLFLTGQRIQDPCIHGQHPLFYGMVQIKGRERCNAYVKMIPAKLVYTEVLSALLGQALGLPIPKTIPVYAKGQTLGVAADHVLCVASLDSGATPISRVARLDEVNDLLNKWAHARTAIVFDELIANGDRNLRNILVGADGKIWLIDHEEAMQEPLSVAHRQIQNYLLKRLAEDLNKFELRRTAQRLNEESLSLRDLNMASHTNHESGAHCRVSEGHVNAVLEFLTDRIQHMPKLLESGLGLNQTHLDLAHERPRA